MYSLVNALKYKELIKDSMFAGTVLDLSLQLILTHFKSEIWILLTKDIHIFQPVTFDDGQVEFVLRSQRIWNRICLPLHILSAKIDCACHFK